LTGDKPRDHFSDDADALGFQRAKEALRPVHHQFFIEIGLVADPCLAQIGLILHRLEGDVRRRIQLIDNPAIFICGNADIIRDDAGEIADPLIELVECRRHQIINSGKAGCLVRWPCRAAISRAACAEIERREQQLKLVIRAHLPGEVGHEQRFGQRPARREGVGAKSGIVSGRPPICPAVRAATHSLAISGRSFQSDELLEALVARRDVVDVALRAFQHRLQFGQPFLGQPDRELAFELRLELRPGIRRIIKPLGLIV
jgi:hypothetical protein